MSDRDYLRADWGGGSRPPWSVGGGFWSVHGATKAVIFGLVGLHLALALLRAVSFDAFAAVYGALRLDPTDVLDRFFLWQIVTGTLLHDPDGLGHILFNSLGLWFFGRHVEEWLGTRHYLRFLLASAVCASLAYLVFAVFGSRVYPMVGASGAVMGVLIYTALRMPNLTVLFMFILPVKLWVLAVVFVCLDLLGMLSRDSNIAHAAHLGGALYGWIQFRHAGRLEGVFGAVDRAFEKRRARRQERERRDEADLRVEIDRILDKVNREGMSALSEEERRFLQRASDKLRR